MRISGGADAIRQYIEAGLIDECTLHVAPALLGSGLRLLEPLRPRALELEQVRSSASPLVTHISYRTVRPPSRQP